MLPLKCRAATAACRCLIVDFHRPPVLLAAQLVQQRLGDLAVNSFANDRSEGIGNALPLLRCPLSLQRFQQPLAHSLQAAAREDCGGPLITQLQASTR